MSKNKLAVGLGKLRWAGKTKAQKRAHMKMMSDKAAEVRSAKLLMEKAIEKKRQMSS